MSEKFLADMFELALDQISGGAPCERLGVEVVFCEVGPDRRLQFWDTAEGAARQTPYCQIRKERSTWFNHQE
jgi:hypothetical protein